MYEKKVRATNNVIIEEKKHSQPECEFPYDDPDERYNGREEVDEYKLVA